MRVGRGFGDWYWRHREYVAMAKSKNAVIKRTARTMRNERRLSLVDAFAALSFRDSMANPLLGFLHRAELYFIS